MEPNILILKTWKNNKDLQKKLNNQLKLDNDFGWKYPKKINQNQRLIFLLDNRNILSILHITLQKNELEFSFSYTPIEKRRNGYNKKLRLFVINKFKKEGYNKYTSTPYKEANSIPLLKSLGFKKKGNQYVNNL